MPWVGHRGWDTLPPVALDKFLEVTLEPGDVLCLPAGTWHSAQAIGTSLALNMAFTPLSGFRFVSRSSKKLFEKEVSWRAGLPPVWQTATDGEDLPAPVRQYIDARLGELRGALSRLSADDPIIARIWRELVAKSIGR